MMEVGNDLQLYKTPMVLTLQGEFEDEEFNEIYPSNGDGDDDDDDDDDGEEEDDDDDEEEEDDMELSLEELLRQEEDDDEEEDDAIVEDDDDDDQDDRITGDKLINKQSGQLYNDDDDDDDGNDIDDDDINDGDDDNNDLSSFWNSSPMGRLSEELSNRPDYSIMRPSSPPDMSDIPQDAYVTIDDERSLQKAHRKADRIIGKMMMMPIILIYSLIIHEYMRH